MSWDQRFFDPIILPGRKPLVTLRDAAQYIMKLPKAEQQAMQWQTAAEVLMLVGEHGGEPCPSSATDVHDFLSAFRQHSVFDPSQRYF